MEAATFEKQATQKPSNINSGKTDHENRPVVGRFAPSPSGRMHLGNIYTAVAAWAMARSSGGRFLLRIEDLDPLRCPKSNGALAIEDLQWLGLDWDNEAVTAYDPGTREQLRADYRPGACLAPPYQSERSAIYAYYYQQLQRQGLIYPCYCSRAQLHVAAAPHAEDGHLLYPGTCRSLTREQQAARALVKTPAWRLALPNRAISFVDGNYGSCTYNLAAEWGDIILRRSDGIYAYQLAVAVDDALMGVNQVVRGCDLLSSTPVQLYLQQQLGFTAPSYFHLPLLLAPGGARLAKRDKSTAMDYLREKYKGPEPIIGYIAYLLGQIAAPQPMSAGELAALWSPARVPRRDLVVKDELARGW